MLILQAINDGSLAFCHAGHSCVLPSPIACRIALIESHPQNIGLDCLNIGNATGCDRPLESQMTS